MINPFVALFVSALIALQPAGDSPVGAPPPDVHGQPAPAAPAEPSTGAPGGQVPEALQKQLAALTALQPLVDEFRNLNDSLTAQRGITPQDRPVIEALRGKAAVYNSNFPANPRGLALEIALSAWLKDHDRVDALYEKLLAAKPDDPQLRLGWARYFVNLNRFTHAKQIIEGAPEGQMDPAKFPQAIKWIADALVARERFDEALQTLAKIPEEALKSDPKLAEAIKDLRDSLPEYPRMWEEEKKLRKAEAEADDLPRVELQTSKGRIALELFENQAPNTVANFISLVESGFYDGTRFHRVITGFMAQGGDPNSKPGAKEPPGQGGPGYTIPDETARDDRRVHFTGSLSMAKMKDPDTGGSQFFMTVTATPWLNGKHTVFGVVTEGLDVVRALELNDGLISAKVVRKRAHEYVVNKVMPKPPGEPSLAPDGGLTPPTISPPGDAGSPPPVAQQPPAKSAEPPAAEPSADAPK